MRMGMQAGVVEVGVAHHAEPLADPAFGVMEGGRLVAPVAEQVDRVVVEHEIRACEPYLTEAETFEMLLASASVEAQNQLIELRPARLPPHCVGPRLLDPHRRGGAGCEAHLQFRQRQHGRRGQGVTLLGPRHHAWAQGHLARLGRVIGDGPRHTQGAGARRGADIDCGDADFAAFLQPDVLPDAALAAGDPVAGGDQGTAGACGLALIIGDAHCEFDAAVSTRILDVDDERKGGMDVGGDLSAADEDPATWADAVQTQPAAAARFARSGVEASAQPAGAGSVPYFGVAVGVEEVFRSWLGQSFDVAAHLVGLRKFAKAWRSRLAHRVERFIPETRHQHGMFQPACLRHPRGHIDAAVGGIAEYRLEVPPAVEAAAED